MAQYPIDDHRPHNASDDSDRTAAVLAHFNVNSEHGDDEAAAVIVRELQNTLESTFVAGIADERDAAQVITRADSLADDLAD